MKAYEIRTARPDSNFESTIINTPIPLSSWECVVAKNQIFVYDKVLYQVSEVKQPAINCKWDADVVLIALSSHHSVPVKKSVRASVLCSDPHWRRLPDLASEEIYLFDDAEHITGSNSTRIGL